ncbi:PKD domain-containing protein, partial [bacterium]|nr:PKD domain-containing protein [bacterium]
MNNRKLFVLFAIFLVAVMTGTFSYADVEPVAQRSKSVGVTTVTWDSVFQDFNYESPSTVRIPVSWTVDSGTASFNNFSLKSFGPKTKKDPATAQLIDIILIEDSDGAGSTGQIEVLFKFTGLHYDKRETVHVGDALFNLKLNMDRDGDGLSDRAISCKINLHVEGVENENTPPVAEAGQDDTVSVGATVTLDGSGSSDANDDLLSFQWSFTSKPSESSVTLSDSTIENPTFVADVNGFYDIQLIVNDGTVDSDPDTVTITANTGQIADAGSNQAAKVGNIVTLDGSGSTGPDGSELIYQWSLTDKPPGSSATLSDPAAINPTINVDLVGTYMVQLTVSDGIDDGGPDTCYITVTERVEGVLLSGEPAILAVDAIYDKPPKADVDPSEVENGIIMTRLEVYLSPDATVGQVNDALDSVGGEIVSMAEGDLALTVSVPRQENLETFQDLVHFLNGFPGIFHASIGREVGLLELPPGDA